MHFYEQNAFAFCNNAFHVEMGYGMAHRYSYVMHINMAMYVDEWMVRSEYDGRVYG